MAYVVEKAGRDYAVIYEGTNPVIGGERRRWRRCPTQADAEALASRLSNQRTNLREAASLLALDDYLLHQWLPAREAALTATTYARYITSIEHYLVPHLGRVQLRQFRADQLTARYRRLGASGGHKGRPLAAKTILNLHQILRLALDDAVEQELIPHNPPTTSGRRIRASGPHRAVGPPPGRPASWASSSTPPRPAATACCSGSPPLPACDAVSCSGSAGQTSTSTPDASRSPKLSPPSATRSLLPAQDQDQPPLHHPRPRHRHAAQGMAQATSGPPQSSRPRQRARPGVHR